MSRSSVAHGVSGLLVAVLAAHADHAFLDFSTAQSLQYSPGTSRPSMVCLLWDVTTTTATLWADSLFSMSEQRTHLFPTIASSGYVDDDGASSWGDVGGEALVLCFERL